MRVIIADSPDCVAQIGGDVFLTQLSKAPKSVFGLATGSSPVALYEYLISAHKKNNASFKKVTTFNLDEYLGLPGDHPQSYRYFMQEALFKHIDIPPGSSYVPDGAASSPNTACEEYEELIKRHGGIDIQLLGLGRNGHIGFNEPSSSLTSRTRIKTLTKATIKDNARFFSLGEVQPTLSLTMGIGTIMDSKTVLLIATGEAKSAAVKAAVEGPVTASCPASILQMHQNAIVLIDREAANLLDNRDFYLYVESQRQKLELADAQ